MLLAQDLVFACTLKASLTSLQRSVFIIFNPLGKFNIDDILPVPTTVSRNVTDLYKNGIISTKRSLKESFIHSPFGFSATTDHWTCKWSSVCSSSFTVHFITPDWSLKNHLLALKRYPSKDEDGNVVGKTATEQAVEIKGIIYS